MATIDTLQINIETNAEKAVNSIDKLQSALKKLQTQVNGDHLKKLSAGMSGLSSAIGQIGNGSISKITRLADAMERLAKASSAMKLTGGMRTIGKASGALQASTLTAAQGTAATATLEGTDKSVSRMERLAETAQNLKGKFAALGAAIKGAGIFHNNFLASLGRIAKYRMMRAIIKSITQAFKEGVQNIVMWSKAIDNDNIINANEVMSAYSTEWLKVKNTLGAMVIPVLKALFPTIQNITESLITAGNALAEIFTLLNDPSATEFVGINPDIWKDYAESIGKTNKQLQKFDELNNITTNSGTGGVDYSEMFEVYKVTRKVNTTFSELIRQAELLAKTVAGIWVTTGITRWGAEVAKIFAPAGSAAMLTTLAGWAAAGVIIPLLIEYTVQATTGKSVNEWLHPLLMGDYDKSILTTLLGGTGEDITNPAVKTLWKLFTPAGWKEMLIDEPKEAFDGFVSNFGEFIRRYQEKNLEYYAKTQATKGYIEGIADAFTPVKLAWETLKEMFDDQQGMEQAANNAFSPLLLKLAEIGQKLDEDIAKLRELYGLQEGDKEGLKGAAEKERATREATKNVVSDYVDYQKDFSNTLKGVTRLSDVSSSAIAEAKNVLASTSKTTSGYSGKVISDLYTSAGLSTDIKKGSEAANVVKDFFSGMFGSTSVSDYVQKNGSLIDRIRKLLGFADGGFPSKGDLFLANEAGAEMVGSIGGRTAVANNDQITQAIASACYAAMSQALSENGMNVTIEGDTSKIFKVVQQQARQYRATTGSYAF